MNLHYSTSINQYRSHFAKLNMYFIVLLTKYFRMLALVKLQTTVMENTNSRQTYFLFMQFFFLKCSGFRHIQTVEPISYNCYKGYIFRHKSLFDRESNLQFFANTASNTSQKFERLTFT